MPCDCCALARCLEAQAVWRRGGGRFGDFLGTVARILAAECDAEQAAIAVPTAGGGWHAWFPDASEGEGPRLADRLAPELLDFARHGAAVQARVVSRPLAAQSRAIVALGVSTFGLARVPPDPAGASLLACVYLDRRAHPPRPFGMSELDFAVQVAEFLWGPVKDHRARERDGVRSPIGARELRLEDLLRALAVTGSATKAALDLGLRSRGQLIWRLKKFGLANLRAAYEAARDVSFATDRLAIKVEALVAAILQFGTLTRAAAEWKVSRDRLSHCLRHHGLSVKKIRRNAEPPA